MQPNEAISALRDRVSIPQTIDPLDFRQISDLLVDAAARQPDSLAFTSLGHSISFAELDALSDAFAAYIQQHTGLKPGDRLAIQLPNLTQYPVVMYGALKAGLVVVNTNPLYTDRELQHQFKDSGARALVVVANVAHAVSEVLEHTDIEYVFTTELADMHGWLSRVVTNFAARYIKKMVPSYHIAGEISLLDALRAGRSLQRQAVDVDTDSLALLQYTGGTTGLAKGAMLTHRNLLSNIAQCVVMFNTFDGLREQTNGTAVLPLPLYHVYACTLSNVLLYLGHHSLLIPNPRDVTGMIATMAKWKIHCFCGLNTLFVALSSQPAFRALDFSQLSITASGGMALTSDAAKRWYEITGCRVYEGYGLTETSPVVSINAGNSDGAGFKLGAIGVALPSTEIQIVSDQGEVLPCGEAGELCVKGPQVMQGYWNLPDKTQETFNEDGWLLTGDIAIVDEDGFPRIVDRKKDMIIVSGFNVYPNEVEDVISKYDAVLECAVIGIPDPRAGEKVRAYVVKNNEALTEAQVIAHARSELAAYKVPDQVVFVEDLPKSNVGKILRRELRDAAISEIERAAASAS